MVEAANAFISNLSYRRELEGTGTVDASYDVHAATRMLASDYRYQRHTARASFTWAPSNVQDLRIAGTAGFLNGTAPLFDRYVAGNSTTLRGYNKFDIAPAGVRQLLHVSADYRYRLLQLFYDAGRVHPVATTRRVAGVLHSVGCGLRKDNMQLAVAFPLRGVRMEPVFLVGVNF
jgi:outer membrane protein assembly factor BamA